MKSHRGSTPEDHRRLDKERAFADKPFRLSDLPITLNDTTIIRRRPLSHAWLVTSGDLRLNGAHRVLAHSPPNIRNGRRSGESEVEAGAKGKRGCIRTRLNRGGARFVGSSRVSPCSKSRYCSINICSRGRARRSEREETGRTKGKRSGG